MQHQPGSIEPAVGCARAAAAAPAMSFDQPCYAGQAHAKPAQAIALAAIRGGDGARRKSIAMGRSLLRSLRVPIITASKNAVR